MRVDARACQCSTHTQQMTVAHGKCSTKLHHTTHVAYVNAAPTSNKTIVVPGNPNPICHVPHLGQNVVLTENKLETFLG